LERVSVTPTVLRRAEHLIFLVVGESKREILARIQEKPETVVAYSAVKGAKRTEIWYCNQAIPELPPPDAGSVGGQAAR
jgi:6-phosphogluconolactonase/glucosamine-6-phosphate isomerase/deaminase